MKFKPDKAIEIIEFVLLCAATFACVGVAQPEKALPVHVVVDKGDFSLNVYRGDSLIHTFPIAVGKASGDKQEVNDNRTPEGDFSISQIQDSHGWSFDFRDGKGPIRGAYGPWFFRLDTSAKRTRSGKAWTGIAIHGTHDPSSVGTNASEGCVRMNNGDLQALKRIVRVGTAVTIRE